MLSVLLCIKNEENQLQECLDSLGFADEVVLIDDDSSDASASIAKKAGVKYFRRAMNGNWSEQRNFGISQCQGDWILVVDADERVSPELAASIVSIVNNEKISRKAYLIKRENYFHSQKPLHGVLRSDWVVRLFPKENARYEGRVHEKAISHFESERIQAGALIHFPYDNWDEYFQKFDCYTKLKAQDRFEKAEIIHVNFSRDILIKPLWAFLKTYFLNAGFLDGKIGFILSVNHYFYTMTKYVRLMELEKRGGP